MAKLLIHVEGSLDEDEMQKVEKSSLTYYNKFLSEVVRDNNATSYIYQGKLQNISLTPKMVKTIITKLDSSKMVDPDCIPLVVLKNCEPDLSYILAELFNMCLKEVVGRSHQWSLYLRTLEKRLLLKTTTLLVFLLWLVKSLKNL